MPRKETNRSINRPSSHRSLWLLAAAIGLCLTTAGAGTLAPADTATGTGALGSENGGYYNTADGYNGLHGNAGKLTTSGNYNIYIGHPGGGGSESKVTRIGKAQTKVFVAGIAGVPLSGPPWWRRPTDSSASSLPRRATSRTSSPSPAHRATWLRGLRNCGPSPTTTRTEPEATHCGLIAEDVDKVMPELVARDDQNRPESVQYLELIPLLLQEWKAQGEDNVPEHELVAQLSALVERQRDQLTHQESELTEFRRTLATRLATLDGANGVSGR